MIASASEIQSPLLRGNSVAAFWIAQEPVLLTTSGLTRRYNHSSSEKPVRIATSIATRRGDKEVFKKPENTDLLWAHPAVAPTVAPVKACWYSELPFSGVKHLIYNKFNPPSLSFLPNSGYVNGFEEESSIPNILDFR